MQKWSTQWATMKENHTYWTPSACELTIGYNKIKTIIMALNT